MIFFIECVLIGILWTINNAFSYKKYRMTLEDRYIWYFIQFASSFVFTLVILNAIGAET